MLFILIIKINFIKIYFNCNVCILLKSGRALWTQQSGHRSWRFYGHPCRFACASASSARASRRYVRPYYTVPPGLQGGRGKMQLLPPASPYYPIPWRKIHTRGNICSFTAGWLEICGPVGVWGRSVIAVYVAERSVIAVGGDLNSATYTAMVWSIALVINNCIALFNSYQFTSQGSGVE